MILSWDYTWDMGYPWLSHSPMAKTPLNMGRYGDRLFPNPSAASHFDVKPMVSGFWPITASNRCTTNDNARSNLVSYCWSKYRPNPPKPSKFRFWNAKIQHWVSAPGQTWVRGCDSLIVVWSLHILGRADNWPKTRPTVPELWEFIKWGRLPLIIAVLNSNQYCCVRCLGFSQCSPGCDSVGTWSAPVPLAERDWLPLKPLANAQRNLWVYVCILY